MVDIDRREFLIQGATTVLVTSTCLCGLGGCAAYTGIGNTPAAAPGSVALNGNVLTVKLAAEPALSNVGGAVKVLDASIPEGLIIARVEENKFEIASLLCTHRGVELEYDHERARFQCPSIGRSVFAFDGARVSGPARRPIRAYDAELNDGVLTIQV